jgi:small subunit ribosomal protein S1
MVPAPSQKATGGWALAEKSYVHGDTLELRVVGYNRGGVLVDLGDVRGFVPASQLLAFPRQVLEAERMRELERYVNRSLRLKVIEFDRARNRLILSERVANPTVSRADQLLATIQPKQTRKGVIRNVTDFGAFIDLGGIEGLIHVSEFSWQHIVHPRDLLAPGQEVEVYVMDVDREQRRIACSLKRLTPDPWAQMAEKLHPGDQVAGVVTHVVSFGAFVRIADGVEGLIHISELAEGNFLHPRDVVREGQSVQARVMSVDPVRQRIGLSLRNGASGGNSSQAGPAHPLSEPSASSRGELRAQTKSRISLDDPPPPPPPDAGYWESLAQSGA